MGTGNIGPPDAFCAQNVLMMAIFGSTFCGHQIIVAIDFINMRTFRTLSAAASADDFLIRQNLAGHGVDGKYYDAANAINRTRGTIVAGSIIIPHQRRINAALINPAGLGPGAANIFGMDHKISFPCYVGGDHIEHTLMITQSGRVDTAGIAAAFQFQLRASCQAMADQLPICQVSAVINRNSWEELKCRIDNIEVLSHPTDTGVRVITGNNRILVLHVVTSLFLYGYHSYIILEIKKQ